MAQGKSGQGEKVQEAHDSGEEIKSEDLYQASSQEEGRDQSHPEDASQEVS
jgi:hypothetical protein